jgi:hypothetical protein
MLLITLVIIAIISAPVFADRYLDLRYSYSDIQQSGSDVDYQSGTRCSSPYGDPDRIALEVDVFRDSQLVDSLDKRYSYQQSVDAWSGSQNLQTGTWDIYGYHECRDSEFGYPVQITDTTDDSFTDGRALAGSLAVQEQELSLEARRQIGLNSEWQNYNYYARIRDDSFGTALDWQLQKYLDEPYFDVGDFKPVVFIHQGSSKLQVVIHKEDGSFLRLRLVETKEGKLELQGVTRKK